MLTHFIRALVNSHYLNHIPLYELDRSLSGFLYTYIFWLLLVRGIVSVTRIPYSMTSTLPTVLDEVAFFGHHSIQTDSNYPNYRPLFELDGSSPGFLNTCIFWLLLVRGIVSVTRIPTSVTSSIPTVLDDVVFFGYHLIQADSHCPNNRPLFELDGSLPGFLNTYIFWLDLVRGTVCVTRIPNSVTSTIPTVLDEVVFFGYHLIQTDSHYPNYRPLFELDRFLPGILYTYIFWLDLVRGIVSVTRIPYSITSTVQCTYSSWWGHLLWSPFNTFSTITQ